MKTLITVDFDKAYDVSNYTPKKIWEILIKLWCRTYGEKMTIQELDEYLNDGELDDYDEVQEFDLWDDFCNKTLINENGKYISTADYAKKYNLKFNSL